MTFTGQLGDQNALLGQILLAGFEEQALPAGSAVINVTDSGRGLDDGVIGINFRDGNNTLENSPGPDAFVFATDRSTSSETGIFGDNSNVIQDFGVGTESVPITKTEAGPASDFGIGIDSAIIGIPVQDSGNGSETGSTTSSTSGQDIGFGSEFVIIGVSAQDSGRGSDFESHGPLVQEFVSNTETVITSAQIFAFEVPTLTEIATAPDFTSFCNFGPETLLPTWHIGRDDTTSLIWKFLQTVALLVCPVNEDISRVKLLQRLPSAQVRENRMLWIAKFAYPVNEDLHVQWIGTDGSSGLTRRAATKNDFETATDPVWIGDVTNKRILIRNLMMKEAALVSDTGVYSISDATGLVPDVGVYWRIDPKHPFRWVDPESSDYNGSNLTFRLPYNGNITARYGSQKILDALASGSVVFHWIGGESIRLPLARSFQPNVFDGYGMLLGMERIRAGELEEEDNLSFKRRMLIEILAPPDSTLGGVTRGIASRIARLASIEWDGVSTLSLDTTGASAITAVHVVAVDRILEVSEQLTPVSGVGTRFYATESDWRPGYLVFVDGVPQPNTSVSGNLVTLPQATSGAVTAEYSVTQYSVVSDVSGNVLSVEPGNGLPSGSYTVLYSRNVRPYVIDLPDVQRTKLLTPDGNPNGLFIEVARLLTEGNPTTFGRARWGANAHWFDREEDRPGITRLPVVFDTND